MKMERPNIFSWYAALSKYKAYYNRFRVDNLQYVSDEMFFFVIKCKRFSQLSANIFYFSEPRLKTTNDILYYFFLITCFMMLYRSQLEIDDHRSRTHSKISPRRHCSVMIFYRTENIIQYSKFSNAYNWSINKRFFFVIE